VSEENARLSLAEATLQICEGKTGDNGSYRLDFRGASGCAAPLLATRLPQKEGLRAVIVTATIELAHAAVGDMQALAPELRTVYLPAPETSPYEETRSDRLIAMKRAAALTALDQNRIDVLVLAPSALVRRATPSAILLKNAIRLEEGHSLEVTDLSGRLERSGYQRVPISEDPGTFAVRGDIIDVWPPSEDLPLRLELDFDTLASIHPYDPETQRTRKSETRQKRFDLPPAREAILTPETQRTARETVQALCDSISLPSSRTRALVEDVADGNLFMGSGSYLPAYFELEALSDRFSAKTPILFDDPQAIVSSVEEELDQATRLYEALTDSAHFSPDEHYVSGEALWKSLGRHRIVCLHQAGIFSEHATGLETLASAPLECPSLHIQSQNEFKERLKQARKADGRAGGLAPLISQIEGWRSEGLCVGLSARVPTQADRLQSLLEHRGLECTRSTPDLARPQPGALHLYVSPLSRGAVAPYEQLVLLTEEEIFARRQQKTARSTNTKIKQAIDDLRSLQPGDFVVHVEHGIGRYIGLEHKAVGDVSVDLLVVEYTGGDRLLLPVYRLNQIQKFSGETAPKMDRLGGQTFAKTKSSVRKRVHIMADQLLRLYAERKAIRRPAIEPPGDDYASFEASFPYEETPDQAAAIQDVLSDLQRDTVMDRLVCGDVGFGKTEVALRAAFLAAMAGRQVALLCPTTVLAEQHLRTFQDRLEDTGIVIRGLSRFQSKKAQTETLIKAKDGTVDIVIGTHRVLSKDVHFKSLGLLIVDEEQRFGVTHKERLKDLKKSVDVLTLSATPIPRTLSLAVGGMRDMSLIATPPQDRRAIRTFTARFGETLIKEAVLRELGRGGQVFYVYNRVEGIYERAEILRRLIPGIRVGVGHGQMSEKELEQTMLGFVQGDFDVLCATAIIESGLDIPRANTIIVDRADLFGLSQLYQLRGRVGRSSTRAYCYLLVPPDAKLSSESKARIETLERHTELGSGFHVATMDMEIRGAGELLGADQSGFMARVGFELFSEMLAEATCELSGQDYVADVDPELSIDVEALLPETYVEDIGARLSLYKKYASAQDEEEISRLNEELTERFGPPPQEARRFAHVMLLKTELRRFRALGLSATKRSASLHLRADTPLSPQRLVPFIAASKGLLSLAPDGKLTRHARKNETFENGLGHADKLLSELADVLEPTN